MITISRRSAVIRRIILELFESRIRRRTPTYVGITRNLAVPIAWWPPTRARIAACIEMARRWLRHRPKSPFERHEIRSKTSLCKTRRALAGQLFCNWAQSMSRNCQLVRLQWRGLLNNNHRGNHDFSVGRSAHRGCLSISDAQPVLRRAAT